MTLRFPVHIPFSYNIKEFQTPELFPVVHTLLLPWSGHDWNEAWHLSPQDLLKNVRKSKTPKSIGLSPKILNSELGGLGACNSITTQAAIGDGRDKVLDIAKKE